MRRRLRGRKYWGLTQRETGLWRFQGTDAQGERVRVSLRTRDADEAVRMRDEILSGTGSIIQPTSGAPIRFIEMAESYLEYDPRYKALANTTSHDRAVLLKKKGRILRFFGDRELDEITVDLLDRYWTDEVIEAKPRRRTPSTGRQDIAAIAAVLRYARKRKKLPPAVKPCEEFIAELADAGTKAARAEQDPEKDIRPVDVADLPALITEARKEGLQDLVYVLLMLDAGLRSGEALGVRQRHIVFGTDDDRNSRKLWIEESRPRGGTPETPKSGRRRTVGLSRRLRVVLLELQRERWNPSPEDHVLQGVDPDNWRNRQWRRITKRAGIAGTRPKDLRDTFGSFLLSNGIPLKYVSVQLGHSSTRTTERHYAKWIHGDDYQDPVRLSPRDLPADILGVHFDPVLTPFSESHLRGKS